MHSKIFRSAKISWELAGNQCVKFYDQIVPQISTEKLAQQKQDTSQYTM